MAKPVTLFVAIGVMSLAPSTLADEWPQWRGSRRDGVWRESGLIRGFPDGRP